MENQINLQALTKEEAVNITYVKEAWTGKEVRTVISTMRNKNNTPLKGVKVGDIAPVLNHPGVIFKIQKGIAYIVILTTEPKYLGIIEPVSGRGIDGYFTTSIHVKPVEELEGTILSSFDNKKQLKRITQLLAGYYSSLFNNIKKIKNVQTFQKGDATGIPTIGTGSEAPLRYRCG